MTPFRWVDASSGAHAAAMLHRHPGARPIASGGDLLEILKEGITGPALEAPHTLVNLASAPELATVRCETESWHLGAMATLSQLRGVIELPPMLHEAIDRLASPQLRARTTLGGNLLQRPRCMYFRHPDIACFKKGGSDCPSRTGPAEAYSGAIFPGACHAGHPSDLAPVLIALQAQAEIVGPSSMRSLPLQDLYDGAAMNREGETVLAPDEVLCAIVVPRHGVAQAFEKVTPRLANEFALASAAVALESVNGRIAQARLVLGGIAPAPRVVAVQALLRGAAPAQVEAKAVADAALAGAATSGASASRVWAARLAIERALARALAQLGLRT
jgi:xanthine dehydrogenase YagS FAD-binding subunit